MKNRFLILSVFLSIVVCAGCKDSLTSNKAEKLIVEALRLPKDAVVDIQYGLISYNIDSLPPYYYILQEKNMFTIEHLGERGDFLTYHLFRVTPSSEAKKFILKENKPPVQKGDSGEFMYNSKFKTAELHFEKILDIHEIPSLNAADIRYVVKYKNFTPFWNYHLARSSRKTDTLSIRTISAIKTDNGWMIHK